MPQVHCLIQFRLRNAFCLSDFYAFREVVQTFELARFPKDKEKQKAVLSLNLISDDELTVRKC